MLTAIVILLVYAAGALLTGLCAGYAEIDRHDVPFYLAIIFWPVGLAMVLAYAASGTVKNRAIDRKKDSLIRDQHERVESLQEVLELKAHEIEALKKQIKALQKLLPVDSIKEYRE
jgi:uncharacterized protein YlxW (UPF0749 family)